MVLGVEPLGDQLVILSDEGLGALFERRPVGIRPPVLEFARAVVPAALVVESVPDLVTELRRRSAVVRRRVTGGVEERYCRMAAGKTISFIDGL